MIDNPVRSWEDVRDMLEKEIEVYYVKNDETNRKREENKAKYIEWIIDQMKRGVDIEHQLKKMPDFTWTFGDEWPYIRKAMMMRYPNCALCGKPTQEIHHVRPRFLKGDNVPTNLIPLCFECHDEVHRRIDKGIQQVILDSIGYEAINRMKNVSNLDRWQEGSE